MFRTNQTSAPIELERLNSKNIQNLEGTHSDRPVFCKTREKNSIFLKKGKTVILVENRKFSRSRMTKRTTPLNSSRKI